MNNNSGFIVLALILAGLCVGAFYTQKKRDAQIAQRQHMSECVQVDAAGGARDEDEYMIRSSTGNGGTAQFVTGENGAATVMRGRQ